MQKLKEVFEGWSGYQTSLLHALDPLTCEQLCWRPAPGRRSPGELIRHLSVGRITWLARMSAPGIETVAQRVPNWYTDADGSRHAVEESVHSDDAVYLREWLELSWQPIQRMLDEWTIDDLARHVSASLSRRELRCFTAVDHVENHVA